MQHAPQGSPSIAGSSSPAQKNLVSPKWNPVSPKDTSTCLPCSGQAVCWDFFYLSSISERVYIYINHKKFLRMAYVIYKYLTDAITYKKYFEYFIFRKAPENTPEAIWNAKFWQVILRYLHEDAPEASKILGGQVPRHPRCYVCKSRHRDIYTVLLPTNLASTPLPLLPESFPWSIEFSNSFCFRNYEVFAIRHPPLLQYIELTQYVYCKN